MLSLRDIRILYDRDHDILDVFLGEPVPSYTDEIAPGVMVRYDFATDKPTGAVILAYSRRDKKELESILPFGVSLPNLDEL